MNSKKQEGFKLQCKYFGRCMRSGNCQLVDVARGLVTVGPSQLRERRFEFTYCEMAHVMLSNSVNRRCLKWIQDNLSTTDDTSCGLQLKDMVHSFVMNTSIHIEPNTFAKILHHRFHGHFKKRRLGSRRIIHYMGLKCLQPPSKSKGICDVPKADCIDVKEGTSLCIGSSVDGMEQVDKNASVASRTSSSPDGMEQVDKNASVASRTSSSPDGMEQVDKNASVASSTSVCTESSHAYLPPFVDVSIDCQATLSEASTSSIKTLDDNTNLSNERVFIYEVGMTKEKAAFLQKFILSKGGARVMFLDINTTCIAFDRNGIVASLTPQRDFDKLFNFGKRLLDTSFIDISLLLNSEEPSQAESKQPNPKTRTLKSPFIKVEDTSGKYSPLHKEFSNREWKTCTSLSFLCPNEKNPSSVTRMKAGDIKRKCPSYCECCDELYCDLTSHLHSEKHRSFFRNQDNFKKLDECINEQPLSAWLASL